MPEEKKKWTLKHIILSVVTLILILGTFILGGDVDWGKAFDQVMSGDASTAGEALEAIPDEPRLIWKSGDKAEAPAEEPAPPAE